MASNDSTVAVAERMLGTACFFLSCKIVTDISAPDLGIAAVLVLTSALVIWRRNYQPLANRNIWLYVLVCSLRLLMCLQISIEHGRTVV